MHAPHPLPLGEQIARFYMLGVMCVFISRDNSLERQGEHKTKGAQVSKTCVNYLETEFRY